MTETVLSSQLQSPANRGSLAVGTRLRNYEILSVLGQGGFGITYRARDLTLDREVAIKEYLPTSLAVREGGETVMPRSTDMAQDFLDGRSRFVDEARTLARFDDVPSIVRVLDFLEANGTAYMVMALVRGFTLADMIRRKGQVEAGDAAAMLMPLLDGLEQVHGAGFLHRDIKPANILVDRRGAPVLIDFGAARAGLIGGSVAATAVFTPGFAAAEQFTAARQGPWTDIYGLSATFYNAIAGGVPPSAFDRLLDDAYRPLMQLAPKGFSHGFLAAIDAGMAVRAADRPQSIADWRRLLGEAGFAQEAATVAMPRPRPKPVRSPAAARRLLSKVRGRHWIYAAFSVALLAFVVGGYLAFVSKPVPRPSERQAEGVIMMAEAPPRPAPETPFAQILGQVLEKVLEPIQEKAPAGAPPAGTEQKEEEEEDEAKADEAAEAASRLTLADRQKIQVVLTSLGFDTGGTDGVFGSRSREMIAAWQKSTNARSSGFLTAAQQQALLKQAGQERSTPAPSP